MGVSFYKHLVFLWGNDSNNNNACFFNFELETIFCDENMLKTGVWYVLGNFIFETLKHIFVQRKEEEPQCCRFVIKTWNSLYQFSFYVMYRCSFWPQFQSNHTHITFMYAAVYTICSFNFSAYTKNSQFRLFFLKVWFFWVRWNSLFG